MLIILCCGFFGVRLAASLKQRAKSLTEISLAVDTLSANISLGGRDIDLLIDEALPTGLTFNGQRVFAEKNLSLRSEDCQLVSDFLKDLGMADTASVIKRCNSYKELIVLQQKKAQREVEERYRLYIICGFISGITLSILWW